MLKFIDFGVDEAVAWRLSGTITEDDMHRALEALRDRLSRYDRVSIYQEIDGFDGVEFDAIMEKLHFLREFGISHFNKIAVVTDRRWEQKVIEWEDRLFRDIDMRAFSHDERERALNFLAYGDDPAGLLI